MDEFLINAKTTTFNLEIVKPFGFIRAKYWSWKIFLNGLIATVDEKNLRVLFQTGVNSSTSYFKIEAAEVAAGLWQITYSNNLEDKIMTGKIELENFTGLTSMPQDAATAWSAVGNLVGATYKPLLFVGKQVAKGTNYHFIAEETLVTLEPIRRLVKLYVNEFNGVFGVAPHSIEGIFD